MLTKEELGHELNHHCDPHHPLINRLEAQHTAPPAFVSLVPDSSSTVAPVKTPQNPHSAAQFYGHESPTSATNKLNFLFPLSSPFPTWTGSSFSKHLHHSFHRLTYILAKRDVAVRMLESLKSLTT